MELIKVKVRDTNAIIFEGEVDRISSFNEMGQFDVYPMHANFISIIRKKLQFYLKGKKLKEIDFTQAVLKITHNIANIFLGIEELVIDDQHIATPQPSPEKK